MTHRIIEVPFTPLTTEAFAPFGTILSPEGRARLPVNTYGDALSLYREAFETDQPIEWFIVQGQPRPMEALFLERHRQITQAFLPLGGQGFVLLVAPPERPRSRLTASLPRRRPAPSISPARSACSCIAALGTRIPFRWRPGRCSS